MRFWYHFKRSFLHFAGGAAIAAGCLWLAYRFFPFMACNEPYFLLAAILLGWLPAWRNLLDLKAGERPAKFVLDVASWVFGAVIGALFLRSTQC